jgi:flagellar motor switch/type III secretory pathway protein FliN
MSAVHLAELERITSLAKTIVAPLAEAWSAKAGLTLQIGPPEAERAAASDVVSGLHGHYWALPVEVTGVHNGVACILFPHSVEATHDEASGGRFVSIVDEVLISASDHLTASLGGPVSLDRLGLRDMPLAAVAGALTEALGAGSLVGVQFGCSVAASGSGEKLAGRLMVAFGGRLLKELTTGASPAGETVVSTPPAAPVAPSGSSRATGMVTTSIGSLLDRARGLKLSVSADIGRKRVKLGELLNLVPGGAIDLDKTVDQPLELWICNRRVAYVDAVVLGGRLGVKLRSNR